MAFERNMTISELILRTIACTYRVFVRDNEIERYCPEYEVVSGEMLVKLMKGECANLFLDLIKKHEED